MRIKADTDYSTMKVFFFCLKAVLLYTRPHNLTTHRNLQRLKKKDPGITGNQIVRKSLPESLSFDVELQNSFRMRI